MLLNLIAWTIFGRFVGALARALVPGRDPMGCRATAVLGVIGSWVAGFFGYLIWSGPDRECHEAG